MPKKKKTKHRNPLVIPAKTRGSAGPMRSKKDKRKSNKKEKFDEELQE